MNPPPTELAQDAHEIDDPAALQAHGGVDELRRRQDEIRPHLGAGLRSQDERLECGAERGDLPTHLGLDRRDRRDAVRVGELDGEARCEFHLDEEAH